MSLSDDVRAAVSLSGLIAEGCEMDARKSHPDRGEYFFRCPFHADGSASLHVTEKPGEAGFFYCYGCGAGRGQDGRGSAIDYVMRIDGIGFAAAVDRLAAREGIGRHRPDAAVAASRKAQADRMAAAAERRKAADDRLAHARAARIWADAADVSGDGGSVLSDYLSARTGGLVDRVPPTLRLGLLSHRWDRGNGAEGVHTGPAMVAAVGRGRLSGIHRTWITPDGRARIDGVKIPKQMLAPCYGHPVRLTEADPDSLLIVGEGIETTLAVLGWLGRAPSRAAEALGLPSHWWWMPVTAEAALSLGALAGPADPSGRGPGLGANGAPLPSAVPAEILTRPGWVPPADHRGPVLILADPSGKCPESARRHATRARAKLIRMGIQTAQVEIAVPRGRWDHDDDWADLAAAGELA